MIDSNNRFAVGPGLRPDWRNVLGVNCSVLHENVKKPAGVTRGVPKPVFEEAAAGIVRFCVDAVVMVNTPEGWKVLLSRRSNDGTFPGVYWINGGGNFAYECSLAFVAGKVEKETGCKAQIGPLVAIAMTSCPVRPCSTYQECYLAVVEYDECLASARIDDDHTSVQLFDEEEYLALPDDQKHWYIEGVVLTCLRVMNS